MKVSGEGEWKVRKHGYSKRRTWRMVHLGLDVKAGQIRAALVTHQDVDDASALSGLLAQIAYFGERDHGFRLNVISESGGR